MRYSYKLAICGTIFFAASSCFGNPDYLPSRIAAYGPEDCKPVVEQEIDRLHIDRQKITKIDYITFYISDSESGNEYNYQGWINFNNCTGNYVVNMNKSCQILSEYPMGSCRLEDVLAKK
ncbi:hypothetical protein GQF03_14575 [Sneathiella chungangensis]|uniref:DUF4377 domain-containing protein n=1 Tax=Sneathiella chungangensis TaxID=1418234 RepID=A0A845MIH6_9PROT|nr:hypothetical protein [Sneathiella chungangensis]MZR23561.1 hypothetical protein [Sneathiella chungangensis]